MLPHHTLLVSPISPYFAAISPYLTTPPYPTLPLWVSTSHLWYGAGSNTLKKSCSQRPCCLLLEDAVHHILDESDLPLFDALASEAPGLVAHSLLGGGGGARSLLLAVCYALLASCFLLSAYYSIPLFLGLDGSKKKKKKRPYYTATDLSIYYTAADGPLGYDGVTSTYDGVASTYDGIASTSHVLAGSFPKQVSRRATQPTPVRL